jgi:hypothetical protein
MYLFLYFCEHVWLNSPKFNAREMLLHYTSMAVMLIYCRHESVNADKCEQLQGPRTALLRVRFSPSPWPRRLRHEPPSLARTLGSWVRIHLEAWVSVCVYSVFVLFCV